MKIDVLYEDNHIIAVNKPAGSVVQEDKTGDEPLDAQVAHYLAAKYHKPGKAFVGVPHRLDRPVSGVILFARTSKALDRLNALFKQREMQKTYWAVVKKAPPLEEGRLVQWLVKNSEKNVVTAYNEEVAGSLRAELIYKVKMEINGFYLIEVNPLTGRPHQIRVQLSNMGSPICGDNKYGYPRGYKEKFIGLHARRIAFVHPIQLKPIEITADLPDIGFWGVWRDAIAEKALF